MGAIPGMLGMGGGAGGTSFASPGQANLIGTINAAGLQNTNDYANTNFQAQQGLLQALQQQQGIQNQSNVYNQLQGVATGQGPNPAQAQYQQNVNNLAQQQAGAIASQKGISPALQARLISQQGSSAMQNAAGQGAANLATQQLGAMGQAGNIAGQQASNQIGQTNANTNAALQQQQTMQTAAASYNNALTGGQQSINSANSSMANTQMGMQKDTIGGVMKGIGMLAGMAEGGDVPSVQSNIDPYSGQQTSPSGPVSKFGQFLKGMSSNSIPQADLSVPEKQPQNSDQVLESGASGLVQGIGKLIGGGGGSGTGLSAGAGESVAPAMGSAAMMAANGGMTHDYRSGGNVIAKMPAQKAVKPGNSYANDKIPAVLSEGEVVIPRNVMQSANPAQAAAKFVQAVIAKRGKK